MTKKTAETVWSNCLSFIEDNVSTQAYKTWFEPIESVRLIEDSLSIKVPSQFFYEWLEEHYVNLLKVALTKELGSNAKLVYSIKTDNNAADNNSHSIKIPSSGKENPKAQDVTLTPMKSGDSIANPFHIPNLQNIKVDSQLNPSYNFESFLEGEANRLARSAGMAVANKPGATSFNPLLIFGGVGLGKTHLAHAIGLDVKEKHPNKTVLYITSEKFTQQYIDATVRNNKRTDFIHFYQAVDVLIVDDIQMLSGKSGTQEVFFHIFNHLYQNGKQVVMTSDKAPVDMMDIESRLLSRFKWGLSAELFNPNFETRKRIIIDKLYRDGMEIPEDVVDYLANNITTNVREMEGALISLIAHATLDKQEVSIALAKRIIKSYVKTAAVKEISIDFIQETVSKYFDLDVETLKSKTRKRNIVQARQISMYFAKKYTKASLASIGSHTGKRDHSTVLHACKTVDNLTTTDKEFKKYVDELNKKLSMNY